MLAWVTSGKVAPGVQDRSGRTYRPLPWARQEPGARTADAGTGVVAGTAGVAFAGVVLAARALVTGVAPLVGPGARAVALIAGCFGLLGRGATLLTCVTGEAGPAAGRFGGTVPVRPAGDVMPLRTAALWWLALAAIIATVRTRAAASPIPTPFWRPDRPRPWRRLRGVGRTGRTAAAHCDPDQKRSWPGWVGSGYQPRLAPSINPTAPRDCRRPIGLSDPRRPGRREGVAGSRSPDPVGAGPRLHEST
jgi:hypothetical protein